METSFIGRVNRGGSSTEYNDHVLPEADLWTAVILQAIQDLSSDSPDKRDTALLWFNSTKDGACSFLWACRLINVEPGFVRSALRKQSLLIESQSNVLIGQKMV